MTIAPHTDREKLIAELAHLQGYEDGVKAVTELMRQQRLRALASITIEHTKEIKQ